MTKQQAGAARSNNVRLQSPTAQHQHARHVASLATKLAAAWGTTIKQGSK